MMNVALVEQEMQNYRWEYKPLSEVAEIHDTRRKPINAKERAKRIEGKDETSLFPYYGATGQVGYIDDYLTDGEYVLLGEDGAPFLDAFASKAYIITGKAWVNNHAHILRSKGDNRFLCYYLNHFDFHDYVSGTTRLKLTQEQMKRIPVPVLPIEKQQRIVARIEELFSQLDDAEATLQKAKAQLALYRQAVLKEAFQGKEQWDKYTFNDLLSGMRNGYGEKPTDSGEYKILRISAVRPMLLNLSDYRMNQSAFTGENLIQENDLLFTRYNGSQEYVGVCARVPSLDGDYAYPDKIIRCRLKQPGTVLAKYLMYYLNSGDARKYIRSKIKTTSGQKGIAGGDIQKTIVYIPDSIIQEDTVKYIESNISSCDSIDRTIDNSIIYARALRESILKQAFEVTI